jgi:F0F1-type ATP synthase membrane subunit c/vacuolar-type H+-ATPase subunit K
MKDIRFMRVGWILVLAVVVLGVTFMTPALASNNTARHTTQAHAAQRAASSSLNAIIYLTTASLASKFQSRINQQVPVAVNTAIVNMISTLPQHDRGWAAEMATTLIQPSAALVNLVPQQGGLAMSLRLNLYPGDPKAITSSMLIKFTQVNSSTVQVSASPMNGGPSLMNGPLTTFQVPLGSLNAVNSTPGCGDAALALNLQFPVSLGQASSQAQSHIASIFNTNKRALAANLNATGLDSANINSFIEVPAASLSSVGSSIGSMPVGGSFTAQNIRISVQGSNIHILSDIYWSGINIGTADTAVAPSAAGGNMVMHVLSTNLSIFGLFSFPMNNYNQQIEQTLNSKLGTAFAGKFYVAQAAIGPNSQLPCAASDSLVLVGNTSALG